MTDNGNQGENLMWPSENSASFWYDAASIGLIVSLVLGVISTGLIWWMGNVKETYLRRGLADTKIEVGQQQERAAKAEVDAADAKKESADATKNVAVVQKEASDAKAAQQIVEIELNKQRERAATAEKTLLELKQSLADRSLSDEQVNKIADKLRLFAGQEYQVTAYWESKESLGIAERINEALQKAGWTFLPMTQYRAMLGGVVGVLVFTHPEADERTKEAAKSLIAALSPEGIQAEPRTENPANNPKHNRIGLNIGSKR